MERKHLYVDRKCFCVWLMALCMAASIVSRVILFSESRIWSICVLPCAAAVLYALIVLLCGKEMFYKSAIPVWMMAIYSGLWIRNNVEGRM